MRAENSVKQLEKHFKAILSVISRSIYTFEQFECRNDCFRITKLTSVNELNVTLCSFDVILQKNNYIRLFVDNKIIWNSIVVYCEYRDEFVFYSADYYL